MRTTSAGAVGLALVDAIEVATKHIIDAIELAATPVPPAEASPFPDSGPYVEGCSRDFTHADERPCLSCASEASIGPDVLTEWPREALPGRWKWSTNVPGDGDRWAPTGVFVEADDSSHGMPRFEVGNEAFGDFTVRHFEIGETFTRLK